MRPLRSLTARDLGWSGEPSGWRGHHAPWHLPALLRSGFPMTAGQRAVSVNGGKMEAIQFMIKRCSVRVSLVLAVSLLPIFASAAGVRQRDLRRRHAGSRHGQQSQRRS